LLLPTVVDTNLRRAIDSAVTAVWGHDAGVQQVAPLTGDASNRSYARLYLRGKTPTTAVAMLLAGNALPLSSQELNTFTEPLKELPYLNLYRFLRPLGVRVPELYYDGQQNGFLLLEDIGDLPLRTAAEGQSAAEIERFYRQAIDQLVLLQIEGTRHQDTTCIAFQQRFDERVFLWEFEHFIEWGLERGKADSLSPVEGQTLRPLFADIAARLDRAPAFLNHRDYHSWNLFVQHNEIRVIDFQDALLAPATYDLATLLNDRDTPTVVSPDLEQLLVRYYCTAWRERGGDSIADDLRWEEYNLCLLQKASKVIGRFYYLELEKGKSGYMRYIPPTLATIRRVLGRLPYYKRLGEIVEEHFPE
jgi:N-acetylmuramate 1-kinase